MIFFRIKNWKKHQHYSDRRPPWIKLHISLFDDYEFQGLPDDSKCHLIMIWLLASRATDYIDSNTLARCYKEKNEAREPILPEDEQYLTRQAGIKKRIALKPLYSAGFIIRYQDASNTIAECSPETEAYRSRHISLEEAEAERVTRPKGNGRFTIPTLDEVTEHVNSRGRRIDPIKFHAHYTSNGWKVGKNPMKSWRAAVVTWERSANQ